MLKPGASLRCFWSKAASTCGSRLLASTLASVALDIQGRAQTPHQVQHVSLASLYRCRSIIEDHSPFSTTNTAAMYAPHVPASLD